MTTATTFKTIHKHKPGTEIEVFGEFFTFSPDVWSFGTLQTENPLVIDRLRGIPEGFKELVPAETPLTTSLAVASVNRLTPPVAGMVAKLEQITAEAAALDAATAPKAPEHVPAAADAAAPAPAPTTETPQQPAEQEAPAAAPYVLRNGEGQELNLSAMDDSALRQFVLDNKLTVPGSAKKGDKLRQAIVDAIANASKP